MAAGSTGTVPATADLLAGIARLPLGMVVLPGLDLHLDERAWAALDDPEPEPTHPQYAMKRLLARSGVERAEVRPRDDVGGRSAERLVGKECGMRCRYRWAMYH